MSEGVAELKSWAVFVSIRPGVRCQSGSVSNAVEGVSSMEEAVPIGDVTLGDSECTGTEE